MHRRTFQAGIKLTGTTLALAALLIVPGCAAGGNLSPLPDEADSAYHLGPGDEVRVITVGEDALSGDFHVSDAGNIALPMLGAVSAAGKTTTQLSDSIATEAKTHSILNDPSISVEVTNYRPIFVLGEVAKPGQYPYQPGMTFLTAVAVAGGFTYRAVQDYGEVVRTTKGAAVNGRVTSNTFLAPGDVVQVIERYF